MVGNDGSVWFLQEQLIKLQKQKLQLPQQQAAQQTQQGAQQQTAQVQVQQQQQTQQLTAVTAPRPGAVLTGTTVTNLQVARLVSWLWLGKNGLRHLLAGLSELGTDHSHSWVSFALLRQFRRSSCNVNSFALHLPVDTISELCHCAAAIKFRNIYIYLFIITCYMQQISLCWYNNLHSLLLRLVFLLPSSKHKDRSRPKLHKQHRLLWQSLQWCLFQLLLCHLQESPHSLWLLQALVLPLGSHRKQQVCECKLEIGRIVFHSSLL